MSGASPARVYAEVIGDPIAHSKSPAIHGFWLEALGIQAEYRACHVRPAELGDFIASRRSDSDWHGCNVTIPHKQAVMPFLDGLDESAGAVGAVNTVYRGMHGALLGTNTDVDGIAEALDGQAPTSGHAVVLGSGGAARAAYAHLARTGWSVTILARSEDKAQLAAQECGLRARIRPFESGTGALDGAGLLINATQLGMHGQSAMPAFVLDELAQLAPGSLVFDMVYAPLETALLAGARDKGFRTSDGLVMLIGQAASAFTRFFGQSPPRDGDAHLRKVLTA